MRKSLAYIPEAKEMRSRGILSGGVRRPWLLRLFAAWALGPVVLLANPTGGSVAAGSASIGSAGSTVTVTQASNRAVINWGTFSIASGETTQFVQPSSTSAVLNRVLGGQTSLINGTLTANGQVYLVNGNGIVVGPGGMVNAAAFTASTRDIADPDFLSGHLHFTGSGNGGVQNLGTITALGGDVVLIGKTVDNQGTIRAPQGTAGLVAADDVLLAQRNADGSTITVNPSPTASSAAGRIGVHNSGSIAAASAELKAANGNLYALAIQNEGTIRATTLQRQGGRIWLKSDQGTVVNTASGVLDASAAQAGGSGGQIETSGEQLGIAGTVTAGHGGSWLLDPINVSIDGTAAATLENALDGGTATTVEAFGGTTDSGIIDVLAAITWTGTGSLRLTATGDINVDADITASRGVFSATADSDGDRAGDVNIGGGVTVSAVNNAIVLSGNTVSVGAGAVLAAAGTFFTTDAVNWNGTGRVDVGGTGTFRLTTLTKAIRLSDTPGTGTLDIDSNFLSHVNYGELDLFSSATGDAIVVDGASLSGKAVSLVATAGNIHFQNNASLFGSLTSSGTLGSVTVDAPVTTDAGGIFFSFLHNSSFYVNADMTSAGDIWLQVPGSIQVASNVTLSSVGNMLLDADLDLNGVGDLTLGAGSAARISGSGQLLSLGGHNVSIDPTAVVDAGATGTLSLVYGVSVGIGTADGDNHVTAANLAHMTFRDLSVSSIASGNAIYVGDVNNTATPTADNNFDWAASNVVLNAVNGLTVGAAGNLVFENVDPLSFGSLSASADNDIVFGGGGYAGAGAGLLNLNADFDSTAVGSLRVSGSSVTNGGAQFVVIAAAVDDLGALDNAGQPISVTYTQNLHLTRSPVYPLSAPPPSVPVVNQPFNSFSQFSAQTQAPSIQTVSSTMTSSTTGPSSFSSSFNSVIPSVRPGGITAPVFVMQGNNAPADDNGDGVLAFGSSYRSGQGQ